MQVQDIMTRSPACCTPATTLQEVARMMADCDCGEIPVLDRQRRPVGVVTDRDICIRAVAQGRDPARLRAQEVMSAPAITVRAGEDVTRLCELMEEKQIRRVPVVDDSGVCCGIVAQADLARQLGGRAAGEVVRDISQPGRQAH
ncbi:MAG: CBS domain-containing protein [Pseudomonadota bacterium]